MIYELRIYDIVPGKLGAINDRFANHMIGFFKKYGIGILGFWTDQIGTSNRVTYMTIFESLADRDAKISAVAADPALHQLFAETEKDGPLADTINNRILKLTPYSPTPKFTTNIQELRVYEAVPGKLFALHDRFANHTDTLLKKHGMEVVAYWTEDVGNSNHFVYMVGHDSVGDVAKSWAAFGSDPEWQKVFVETERDGALVRKVRNTVMRPTSYSPKGGGVAPRPLQ